MLMPTPVRSSPGRPNIQTTSDDHCWRLEDNIEVGGQSPAALAEEEPIRRVGDVPVECRGLKCLVMLKTVMHGRMVYFGSGSMSLENRESSETKVGNRLAYGKPT